jgi:hypothetical protein
VYAKILFLTSSSVFDFHVLKLDISEIIDSSKFSRFSFFIKSGIQVKIILVQEINSKSNQISKNISLSSSNIDISLGERFIVSGNNNLCVFSLYLLFTNFS